MEKEGNPYEQIEYNLAVNGQALFRISRDPSSYVAPHWHDAVEVICLLEGELSVTVERRTWRLREGDCVILNPYAVHSTLTQRGNTSLLLQIPVHAFEEGGESLANRQFICDPASADETYRAHVNAVTDHLRQMMLAEQSGEPGAGLRSAGLLLQIVYELYSHFSHTVSAAQVEKSRKNRQRLTEIFQYTEAHYAEPVTLEAIAGALHLQVNYFCHYFRKNTGMTYMAYLNDYRLAKLYRDLLVTDIPIKYLLERHGLSNYKRFRQSFLEKFQATPSQIRAARNGRQSAAAATGR